MGILTNARPVDIIGTRDRERAKTFYRDTLGLTLVKEDHFAAVFEAGGATIRVSTVPDWTAHSHTAMGFVIEDIETTARELAGNGVVFNHYDGFNQDALGIWTSPDRSARVAWFHDPDGNVLSVTEFAG